MTPTKQFLFLFLLAASLSSFAQPRLHVNFDEGWKFHFGHAANPAKDFNYGVTVIFKKSGEAAGTAIDPKLNDKDWRTLDLPHDWAVELPFANSPNFDVQSHGYKPVGGLYPETSIGWYRKHFTIDRRDSGQRFQVQFDGVFRNASFWINGFYLGTNSSGYVGAVYDITDYLQFNKDNVLAVRVDATQYEGWFYEGAGIYRHVWLNQTNNLHLAHDGVFAYSTVNGKNAVVQVETEVENSGLTSAKATVETYLTDRTGKKLAQATASPLTLSPNGKTLVKQKLSLANVHLWSLDDPYLYRVVSLVKQNGRVIDSNSHRLGVRTIEIKANGVFLNGQHVKIKGTNNHQDHAGVGSALPDYLQYYRIRLLKEMGSNAYRTSHHAPTPELLDACDSLGMLVLDEQRLLNSSPEYMDQFERLIRRDRNHPSVFLWSIGNEEGWLHTTSIGKRVAQTLIARQKELDPTRTSTYAADLGNVFQGVNEVIPVRGFNYREKFVAAYHHDHPAQPIIGTEMGSTVTTRGQYEKDSVRAYLPDEDITAPWWASTAEAWWTLAAPNDFWLGGFIWTGFDYRGEPTPYQWPNINSHFGVMDVCGFPKNIYYYYQSWWTDKDVLHISPHWNWKGREGQPIDVWVNSNADNVELFLNGKSLGKKDMPRNGHLQWSVAYAPGTLEAVAFKKGKKLTAKVETTGAPAEVVVSPSRTTVLADGKDAAVMNISVVDRQGREVPDAMNLVCFSVTGDAKIIGVGNGDPSSHEQDKYFDTAAQRHLFNGKCQVILLAGKTPSTIKFEAKSEGLWAGSTDIFSIQPGRATVSSAPVKTTKKETGKIIGADISFLPELEAKGVKFSDKGIQKDAIQILKDHGFNYIRLRIFNNPAADSGYSPGKGFCDLAHTRQMAKRIKAAGMKFLLDFHYSDYWADPGKQYKPAAWKGLAFAQLKDSVYQFTKRVITELKAQGTTPDMVQVGNEINHGIIWPEGHVAHFDSLAQLFRAGSDAVLAVDPSILIMLHIALGGQNDESVFFLNNMLARGVSFDVIGESYYPKWHGTLSDLQNNLTDLARRYNRDVIVVEYSQLKKEVHDIAFNLPDGRGKGTFIWEPLSTWEAVFDKDGKANQYLELYDEMAKQYLK
ncbi:beta-galactosidase GalA [Flavisolibacter nicotianae]|uniref:beta-galactosidase GalA n=1 Tax=Flavisolibacter nicotianae TaxID=2364882 RepID=UPI000EACA0B6|nr:beta-galactosidase GalA [Flavisolibacter nicotianae]